MSLRIQLDDSEIVRAAAAITAPEFKRQAGRVITPGVRVMVNEARKQARRELMAGHPKARRMRDRIRTRFSGWGFSIWGGAKSTGVASNLVVGGTRPHRIAGPVMPMWMGSGGMTTKTGRLRRDFAGITGFATAVEHPGTTADPFFARGLDRSEPVFRAEQQKLIDGLASGLAAAMEGKR